MRAGRVLPTHPAQSRNSSTLLDDAPVHQTQKWIRSLTSPTQVWICVDPNRPFARDGMRGPDCRGNIGGSTLAVPASTRLIADCSRHEPPGISGPYRRVAVQLNGPLTMLWLSLRCSPANSIK